MSRIMKRPMFRKGGSAGQGIMSKVEPRQGYARGKSVKELYDEYSPLYEAATKPMRDDSISKFLIRGGMNLIDRSDKDTGFLQSLTGAYREPTEKLISDTERADAFARQGQLAALGSAIKSKQIQDAALSKKGFASQTFAEQVKNKQNFYKGSALTPKAALKFSRNAIKEVRAERALGTKFYGPVDKIETATAIAKQSPEGTVFLDVDRASYFMVKDNKVIPVTFEQAVEFNMKK